MERTQSNLKLFDKVFGSLIGFAIGDAMGATTEFMSRAEISARYDRVTTILGGGWLNLEPGETTDDTRMMMDVARAYIACVEHKNNDFLDACCHRFCIWYNERPKDIGNACRNVISTCMGQPVNKWLSYSAKMNAEYPTLGNGSLMRCLFPALVGDTDAAIEQGLLTHNNPECSERIGWYVQHIQRALNSTNYHVATRFPKRDPEGHVSNTFYNALYWNCCTNSFKEAILGAVNDGGDADTIAALTGGLAGARYGFTKIPADWVKKLNETDYTELRKLAEKAIEIIAAQQEEQR